MYHGDAIEVMAQLPANSVDAIVTDPPYGLEFMGKTWDRLSDDPNVGKTRRGGLEQMNGPRDQRPGSEGGTWFGSRDATAPNYSRTTNAKCRKCGKWRVSGGHDGKGSTLGCKCAEPDFPHVERIAGLRMQEWHQRWATEALRVAKPGAYLLAFGGTRTYHRLACAIEDAGWIIRDCLVWAYAQGFPKSRSLLKPAWEPIVMARKPGPLRELAIDACRIGVTDGNDGNGPRLPEPVALDGQDADRDGDSVLTGWSSPTRAGEASAGRRYSDRGGTDLAPLPGPRGGDPAGRWPANVVLTDGIFDGGVPGVVGGGETTSGSRNGTYPGGGYSGDWPDVSAPIEGDTGTYSRFFLIPKADRAEREPVFGGLATTDDLRVESAHSTVCAKCGRQRVNVPGAACACAEPEWIRKPQTARRNHHPTVKPLDLMRHLVRLVTPVGGTVLDPFLGSGTTAIAAEMEGFAWLGIEKEAEYVAIAEARLQGVQRGLGLDVPAPTPIYNPGGSLEEIRARGGRHAVNDPAARSQKSVLFSGLDNPEDIA